MKKRFLTPFTYKQETIEYFTIFGFNLIEEHKPDIFGDMSLVFSRDEKPDNNISSIMNKNKLRNNLPFFPLVIMLGIVIILATLFLVFCFTDSANKMTYFLSIMIPCLVILVCSSAYSIGRHLIMNKNVEVLVSLSDIKKQLK